MNNIKLSNNILHSNWITVFSKLLYKDYYYDDKNDYYSEEENEYKDIGEYIDIYGDEWGDEIYDYDNEDYDDYDGDDYEN